MKLDDVEDVLADISKRLTAIEINLAEHMARSKASEDRLEFMEDFATKALETQQANFKDMLVSNKDNQASLNKQLKIIISIVTALATLVTATAVWINKTSITTVPQTQIEVTK